VLKFGLIGCGAVASWCHLPALRRLRNVTVVAAADPDAGALARMKQQFRGDTHVAYQELLARPDIDAVVISVPPAHHAAVACAAAAARKAFYLEKPIAVSQAEAREVAAAVSSSGVATAMGFNRRLHPLYRQAKGLIQDGAIGRVRFVHSAFCEPAPSQGLPQWKLNRASGGGVLLDLASHHVDLLRWFLGEEVASVEATVTSEGSEQDGAQVRLAMRGGVQAQGSYSFRAGYADYLEFVGDRGGLRVDRHRATLGLRQVRAAGYGSRTIRPLPSPEVAAWWVRRLVRRFEDPSYFHALQAFTRQLEGGPQLLATLDDGARSLEVILGAEESARIGRPVRPGD